MNFSSASFSCINPKPQPPALVIYSTLDTSFNVMTFTIKNTTGTDLTLKGGLPVNGKVAGGTSSFLVNFGNVLTPDQLKAMKVSDDQQKWGYLYFDAQPHDNPYVSIAPKADLVFPKDSSVVLTFTLIECTTQTSSNFNVKYFNVPTLSDRSDPYGYHIVVLNPPVGNDLRQDIDFGLVGNSVFHYIGSQTHGSTGMNSPEAGPQTNIPVDITYDNAYPINNGFALYIKNTLDRSLEKSDQPLGNAVFQVSMVFGTDDNDAITTQTNGDNIKIGVSTDKTSKWGSQQHAQQTGNWNFNPLSNEILLSKEVLQFSLSNIITALNTPVGSPPPISTLYIQWNFIPNYADGFITFEMQQQVAQASITGFTVNPTSIQWGGDVNLTFSAEVARLATIEYYLRDRTYVKMQSPDDFPSWGGTFKPKKQPDLETTRFMLSVYDARVPAADQKPIDLNVVQPIPSITSFTADSLLVNTSGANTTTLRWDIANLDGVKDITISGIEGSQMGKTSIVVTILKTITYTLTVTPWSSGMQQLTKSLTIYSYSTPNPASINVGAMGDGTAYQCLPLAITNVDKQVIYAANAAEAKIYQVKTSNKTASPDFAGNVMVLSNDEKRLFTAQSGAGPIGNVYTYDTSNPAVVFSLPQPGPPPYSMAVTKDCTKLFYMQRHLLSTINAYTVNESANNFTYVKDIGVGTSPQAYAFNEAGDRLYVANYDSNNLTVIDVTGFSVVTTIALQSPEPNTMVRVKNILFIACSGNDKVCPVDISTNPPTNLTPITCGFQPFTLTLNQNNDTLYVTNFQGGTVTVIDVNGLSVKTTINVGNGPSAAMISKSGALLFVTNYCDKSLSVVDISATPPLVLGAIPMESTNGNPIGISTFYPEKDVTEVYVAKEYFKGRNNGCPTSTATDASLNMSIFIVLEKPSGVGQTDVEEPKPKPKPKPVPVKLGLWRRFLNWLKRLFGGKK